MGRICFFLALSLTLSALPLAESFRRSKIQADSAQSVIKSNQVEHSKGDHSDAFDKAHDALVEQLTLKQQALRDWFSENDILQKENDLKKKQQELSDYMGENADAWWKHAFSWIERSWLNLVSNKQERLEFEVTSLKEELAAMRTEKAHLEKEVAEMIEAKDKHKDDARNILDGLTAQIESLRAEIDNYKKDKAASELAHAAHKRKQSAEDAAAVAIITELIKQLDTGIHEKRDLLYSLTATCSQFEKKGSEICHRCSGDRACGDSCIGKGEKCSVFPGCACDDAVGHDLHQQFQKTKAALEFTIQLHNSTIHIKREELLDAQKAIEMIDDDKAKADAAYATKKTALTTLKGQLEQEKTVAEEEKGKTEQNLASATQANAAAVSKLEDELQAALSKLQESRAKEKQSKTALLAAQEAKMRELLDNQASKLASWEAHIFNSETEKARVDQEAADLAAALVSAA